MGGESRSSLIHDMGYSDKAHCIGKRSYLEPISGSLHVPIEGVYRKAEKIEDRVAIGEKHNQNHAETRSYLEPIRNRMHEPIEGLPAQLQNTLHKEGGGLKPRAFFNNTKTQKTAHRTHQQHAATVKTQFTRNHKV